MKLLILGGGVFLGAHLLNAALARGHAVTVFNRGRARSTWPAGVEAMRDACACCLLVSRVSANADTTEPMTAEDRPLPSFEGIARDDRDMRHYGAQKAACEAEVMRVFGARALIVRPGLIDGPGDRSGRFGHWVWRAAEGGTMLVPDVPADKLMQHGVQPWSELPLWLPSIAPEYAGFNRDLTRAAASGLRTRALQETIATVLEEGIPPADDKRRAGKLTRERETALLDA